MFHISKIFRFEAAHHLPRHDGRCARVHGHSWVAKVTIGAQDLIGGGPKTGMVMDYGDLKAVVQPIIDERLDHWDLNETLDVYPTSENIARWLYEAVEDQLGEMQRHFHLTSVEINETCTSACIYTGEQE